jgi:RNA polymerase sigma factor (sigma-70 family)
MNYSHLQNAQALHDEITKKATEIEGKVYLFFDEIQECIPSLDSTENIVEEIALTDILNRFLSSLSLEQRKIFMRRYWYLSPIKEIATEYGMSESKIKMSLFRSRNELKKLLEKEGISV